MKSFVIFSFNKFILDLFQFKSALRTFFIVSALSFHSTIEGMPHYSTTPNPPNFHWINAGPEPYMYHIV